MFTVGTVIRKSTIPNAGLGVFTTENIKKGDVVYTSGLLFCIDDKIIDSLPVHLKSVINKYSELHKGLRYLYFDNGSYTNHSIENANFGITGDFYSDMVAFRDIFAGEELLCNYYLTDDDAVNKLGGLNVK